MGQFGLMVMWGGWVTGSLIIDCWWETGGVDGLGAVLIVGVGWFEAW